MKKYLPWIIVAIILVAGYMMLSGMNSHTVTLVDINGSQISGSATLTENGDNLIVTLNLNGAPAGVAMPAHIHEGMCPGIGAVKYPLTSVTDGTSTTTLSGVTLENLKAMLPLAINVHKSAAEASVYVSCGSIEL